MPTFSPGNVSWDQEATIGIHFSCLLMPHPPQSFTLMAAPCACPRSTSGMGAPFWVTVSTLTHSKQMPMEPRAMAAHRMGQQASEVLPLSDKSVSSAQPWLLPTPAPSARTPPCLPKTFLRASGWLTKHPTVASLLPQLQEKSGEVGRVGLEQETDSSEARRAPGL